MSDKRFEAVAKAALNLCMARDWDMNAPDEYVRVLVAALDALAGSYHVPDEPELDSRALNKRTAEQDGRVHLLGDALGRVLVHVGVLRPDVALTGPALLVAAETFLEAPTPPPIDSALRIYGGHRPQCDRDSRTADDCPCGFTRALAGVPPLPEPTGCRGEPGGSYSVLTRAPPPLTDATITEEALALARGAVRFGADIAAEKIATWARSIAARVSAEYRDNPLHVVQMIQVGDGPPIRVGDIEAEARVLVLHVERNFANGKGGSADEVVTWAHRLVAFSAAEARKEPRR